MVKDKEIWIQINGATKDYKISNHGRVETKLYITHGSLSSGYFTVNIKYNNKFIPKKVHRLVAKHFVSGYTNEKNEVGHMDDNPKNNYYKNLQWTTHFNNMQHKAHEIAQYSLTGNFIKLFPSSADAARKLNTTRQAIRHAVVGTSTHSKSFLWLTKYQHDNNAINIISEKIKLYNNNNNKNEN